MEKEYEFNKVLNEILLDIDDFCQNSFKILPEKCMPFIMSFIQRMEQLIIWFVPKQVKKVKKILPKILEALQNKDYVLVRDYLYYEMKPFLQDMKKI